MSCKFISGFLVGAYVSTKYDLNPYVKAAESSVIKYYNDTKVYITKEYEKEYEKIRNAENELKNAQREYEKEMEKRNNKR